MTTTTGVDARGYLAGWAMGLADMYAKDIRALPEDKWTATFGGCTRPASDLTADALSLMQWTTAKMKGEEADHMAMMEALGPKCADKASAEAELHATVGAFGEALRAASDDTLNAEVMPAWQMPAPLFIIANIAVSHLWYHDGQLNYIQALLGDDKVHWME